MQSTRQMDEGRGSHRNPYHNTKCESSRGIEMHLFTNHFLSGRPQPGGLTIFKAVKYLQHGSLFQHKYDKIILGKWKTWDYLASLLRNHLAVNSDRTSSPPHTHTLPTCSLTHTHTCGVLTLNCWPSLWKHLSKSPS